MIGYLSYESIWNYCMEKILIVDDYQEIRNLYTSLLQKKGYIVEAVESAELGVKKILEDGYDLVLLDLLMPEKDGLWVLDQIKNNLPQKSNSKIVIMSFIDDKATRELIERALINGASAFLDKKTSLDDDFVKKIEEFLKR